MVTSRPRSSLTAPVSVLACAVLILTIIAFASPPPDTRAGAATFTVNSAADTDTGTCDPSPGDCTLRDAIDAANANANGTDTSLIAFDLPGCPPSCTIDVSTALPTVFGDKVSIDGTTQDGYVDQPIVTLNRVGAGIVDGPFLNGGGSSVIALVIVNFRFGLVLTGSSGTADQNQIINADADGIFSSGPDMTITNNLVQASGRIGMNASSGNGIPNSQITGNTVTGSADTGMRLQGDGLLIANNTVSGNMGRGIEQAFGNTNVMIESNVVMENALFGIQFAGVSSTVRENTVTGNGWSGMALQDADIVVSGNTVTGNGHSGDRLDRRVGIELFGRDIVVTGNEVSGNAGDGILLGEVRSARIGGLGAGDANLIAGNGDAGVHVLAAGADAETDSFDNTVSGNVIRDNGGLGIDLSPQGVNPNDAGDADLGANRRQNYPVLDAATTGSVSITGTLDSTPQSSFRLEFFTNDTCDASGHGEGEDFLISIEVTTGNDGLASFTAESAESVPAGKQITATATNLGTNDTSEFSSCATVAGPPAPTPTPMPPTPTPMPTPTPTPMPTPPPTPVQTPTPTSTPVGRQGDTDCDGDVDSVDSLHVLRDVADIAESACIAQGDINCDGNRTSVDSLGILRYVVSLPPLPQNEPCANIGDVIT